MRTCVPAPYVRFQTIAEGGCRHDAQERGEASVSTQRQSRLTGSRPGATDDISSK